MCMMPTTTEQGSWNSMPPMAFNDCPFSDVRQAMCPWNSYQSTTPLGLPSSQPVLGQIPPHFDAGMSAPFGGFHVGVPTPSRMQTGCMPMYPAGQDQGAVEMRCIQRTILHRLEEMERSLMVFSGLQEKLDDVVRDISWVTKKMAGMDMRMDTMNGMIESCREKITDSSEKLETVRVGLHDFASDVNAWIHAGNGSDQGDAEEGEERPDSVAAETPGSDMCKGDLLQYIDGGEMNFNFE
ncbi:hypothetical protein F5Y06DRAFT_298813 [Hypoxylon sp. FL0890]|nr:hypothetical protein F5Y06DRAFT_298813 [Hypoxylon sp. FL0890]